MNESSVQPVNSVRFAETGLPSRVMAADRTDGFTSHEQATSEVERSIRQTETEKSQNRRLSNIAIHFNVDDETNRLIVVVTERESGRVIRTIPASEFEKLQAGDLLKLTV